MKKLYSFLVLSLFIASLQAQTYISTSTIITQLDVDYFSWPVTINGGTSSDPVVITLAENIFLNQPNSYFIIGSEYVTFNGNNKTVSIDNISDYPGLFQNSYDFVTINNTSVHSNGATLLTDGGWIGQTNFGNLNVNDTINNCFTDGAMTDYSGGITGSYSSCIVINCHSSGDLSWFAGGIFGIYGSGTAINCYSTGNAWVYYSGGIFGAYSSGTALDCYSTGLIGYYAGGIFGYNSNGFAIKCYSSGIIPDASGGIAGPYFTGTIENCFSTGAIGYNAGGITGQNNEGGVLNSYSTGTIDPSGGGITGPDNLGTITNCIGENGTWNDVNAISVLTGTDGSIWTDINLTSVDIPYQLASFDSNLYSPATEDIPNNSMINSPEGNFYTGNYSLISINDADPSLNSTITINSGTGIISFANSGVGSFNSKILYTDLTDGSYQISNYLLNILSTLPVTWQSFTVTPRGNAAWLQWSTANEFNTRDFNVQYSTNGSSWITIGTVSGAGISTAISKYSFLHADPVKGNNYYRIQQTDVDGKYNYSTIQNLKIAAGSKSFSVLNTIVTNGVLQVDVKSSPLLQLYSNDGKLIWKKQFTAGLQTIDLSGVSKGVYYLKGKDAVEKIFVQ